MNRTLALPVVMLGIMKSGAAFLPLDPQYPIQRIRFILEDSGCTCVIADDTARELASEGAPIVCLEEIMTAPYAALSEQIIGLEAPAYLLYTSGSTGQPKGVVISQRALAAFILGIRKEIAFRCDRTILFLTTVCFDISLLELLVPLLYGMRIVIADERVQRNPYLLKKLLIEERIDMLQMTPSAMQLLLDFDRNMEGLQHLSDLLLGGEALPASLFQRIRGAIRSRIYNLYGPTESTIWCMASPLHEKEGVTLGHPFCGVQLYVLGPDLEHVADGQIGELYIGGPQIAEGYLNREQLTAERFLWLPQFGGNRLFKTGDLVRYDEGGDWEYCGRNDQQVKIRGFRIEPHEIESVLLKQDGIARAVVVPKKGKQQHPYLCAYYVSHRELERRQIVKGLKKELPGYMIPEQFIRLERLPYTPNFKIDRKALQELEVAVSSSPFG
jgi:amino acid adenylation domain-containing protein